MNKLSVSEAFDSLNESYRLQERKAPGKQKLIDDLLYTTSNDITTGHEPIVNLGYSTAEKLWTAFQEAGFINDNDEIVLPAGTILTFRTTANKPLIYNIHNYKTKQVTQRKIVYDIYYVQGNPKCLVAINPQDNYDLFGPDVYKDPKFR